MQQLSATSGAHQQRLATNRRNGTRTSAAPSRGALARRACVQRAHLVQQATCVSRPCDAAAKGGRVSTLDRLMRKRCARPFATLRHIQLAMRGQRAWFSRTHVRAARGRGPPHAAAAGGRSSKF
ncbi:hypothetical protein F511_03983 [Dorcoceras hygrometricum]|uniref:Uncharacterized protein n=1 Tax=Dorcoceras hygrometricum TaxID=472368 RepID=A0A2Z7D228_9LAMI|nr:hypothetical protein F511_03983 [Dorcoceras hygrometricum]